LLTYDLFHPLAPAPARWVHRCALLSSLALCACVGDAQKAYELQLRDDLFVQIYTVTIDNGLTETVRFSIPAGTRSILIEVNGSTGKYYLTKFITPSKRDLIEAAVFVTREGRALDGLGSWLFPNAPDIPVQEGEYALSIRAENWTSGYVADGKATIAIYTKSYSDIPTCGLHIDFLIDSQSIDVNDFQTAADRLCAHLNEVYATQGIRVIDYLTQYVNMVNIDVDASKKSLISVVGDILHQARQSNVARSEALHVLMVRNIGGISDPLGYAVGLPGPYDADLSSAAVLIATGPRTDPQGFLDLDGLSSTLTHEVGHYMGLFHPSEVSEDGDIPINDPIPDTPTCDNSSMCSTEYYANIMASGGKANRSKLSKQQGQVVANHPLCIPFNVPSAPQCTLLCQQPTICALTATGPQCLPSCDPKTVNSCALGFCQTDQLNVSYCADQ
jgi:hypothetical protein